MEYIAVSKNVDISPRKGRLVVEKVRNKSLEQALLALSTLSKRAALPIKKTIESAVANAVNNFKVKKEDLVIKELLVNEGISYKRYHFAARGRVRPYKKRRSHIKVILEDKIKDQKSNIKNI